MNVTFEKTDDLNAILSVSMDKSDYEPKVEEQLKTYRKKAQIPGFRPGTAPMGMLKKLYGKAFMAEEVNKLATEKMYSYLQDNKIDILGQPLLSNTKKSDVDFENAENFTFHFDLGMTPEFDFNISESDSITKYIIEVDDKEVEREIENLQKQHGTLEKIEVSENESDSILVILTELDEEGNPLEGGVKEKETTIVPELIQDQKTKDLFKGVKTGDVIKVNLKSVFNDNETVISSSTGIPKEGLNDLNPVFNLEVKNIQKFTPSELNQELFDKVFGEGKVDSEEAFREKVKENTKLYFESESEHHLEHELDHFIMDKHSFALPDEFLKRWLINAHPDTYNEENAEERYSKESGGLRFQLIQEKAIQKFNLEVSEEDLNQTALGYSASLLRNYGIPNPDFEWVKEFTEKQKGDKKFMDKVREIAIQRAVISKVKEVVTLVEQKISIDDFYAMIKEHNHKHHH
ncbi:MAG: trigger factor [Flavobacteriales bacterium]|nr:trigger factor [Flavobacteriales bacterium]